MLALATKLKITQGYNIRLCLKKKKDLLSTYRNKIIRILVERCAYS